VDRLTEKSTHGPIISVWLPLAVIRKSGMVQGITRLQKLVFLASIEGHIGDYLGFTEYKYGPWSQVLQNMVNNLTQWGHLECIEEPLPEPYSPRQNFSLTSRGEELLTDIENSFDPIEVLQQKLEILNEYEEMSTNELRDYVYRTYLPHKKPDELTYEERLRFVLSETQSYLEVWNNFEDEHYPISYYALAVLEHIERIITKLDEHKSTLENNIILTSCSFLLRTIWRLLNTLETTDSDEPQRCTDIITMKGEVEDILSFTDAEAMKVLSIIPFHEIKLSDLTMITNG
jgi:uncharacterized protein YwgA